MFQSKLSNFEVIEYDDDDVFSYLIDSEIPIFESTMIRDLNDLKSLPSNQNILYQLHFSLFHKLYLMKTKFGNSGYYLHIDSMRIKLLLIPKKNCCQFYDAESGKFCNGDCESESIFCEKHNVLRNDYNNTLIFDPMRTFYENKENILFAKDGKIFEIMNNIKFYALRSGEYENALKIFDFKVVSKIKLRKKYIELSKMYHPDNNGGNNLKMKDLNWAYNILKGVSF